jgi:hypothetical protein
MGRDETKQQERIMAAEKHFVLTEISKNTGINIDRLGVSPTVFMKDWPPSGPLKFVTLDGHRLPTTGWVTELAQDTTMSPGDWEAYASRVYKRINEAIIDSATRDIEAIKSAIDV